ncbi:vitamin B12 dependent-methionine synthase activation domain-containing protein [Oribacterium sp. WCC10]|uniref:vitamin B12 dependent-methionine synthase activation domain-containing protein n=1 Tax=Oribacterium sp. WCC10 TaxID=1855343 RepID=UPI001A9A3604|nr:vitamin B12 dependent-methionine synthase activation domain-containing protein [Oribacterium sp. WCC10]
MQKSSSPRCFYRKFSVAAKEPDVTEIAGLSIHSKNLYKNLSGCDYAYMFAATVGIGIDHLIKRGEVESIMDAAIYQAAGAAMIEAYADSEVEKIRNAEDKSGYRLRPRYSPGYGDLPLALQSDFARILDMQKWCGISLTDTLLMVPSKSITAFIGCAKSSALPESDYLAKTINPMEATGLSAKGATGNEMISRKYCNLAQDASEDRHTERGKNLTGSHSCHDCRKAKDCLYRMV